MAHGGIADPLGRQLRCPAGWGGRLVGRAMEIANRGPYAETIRRLDVAPGVRVLELGFGPGLGICRLAELVPRGTVAGIDASPVMVRRASRRNAAAIAAGRVRLLRGDFAALPFARAAFDRVLAVNVVYFWDRPEDVMGEIVRVTRPGGRIAVFATHCASMAKWPFAGEATHRHWDERSLAAALSFAGRAISGVTVEEIALAGSVRGLCAVAQRSGTA
jgi:SAM-dependent methyltransferase